MISLINPFVIPSKPKSYMPRDKNRIKDSFSFDKNLINICIIITIFITENTSLLTLSSSFSGL